MPSRSTYRGLLSLMRGRPWGFAGVVILGLLQSITEGVGVGLFIPLLMGLGMTAQPQTSNQWLVSTLDRVFASVPPEQRLGWILLCIFGAVIVAGLLSYLHSLVFCWLEGHVTDSLRQRIFTHVLHVELDVIERDRTGRWLNILASDSWHTGEALRMFVEMMVTTCTIAVYIVLLLLMSWRLTLVVAVAMLAVSGLVQMLTRAARRSGDGLKSSNSELADRMIEGIDGVRVIRAFGQEAAEQRRFNALSNRVRYAMLHMRALDGLVHPVHEVLAAALLLATVAVSAPSSGNLPVLLVFAFALSRVQPRMKQFDAARLRVATLAPSVDEVIAVIGETDAPSRLPGSRQPNPLTNEIRFDDVSFQYASSDQTNIDHVSFTIPAGRTTALVGPSGAGKTTLVKLLLRFHEPDSGRIIVDGVPLSDIDVAVWRRQTALVSQDVFLFNSTVRDNIAYGSPDATPAAIVEAARQAGAHDFIERLPEGYDTMLGPRGVRLSGGERQRISVARAIIRDPRVLILDEATNALDSVSEQWIQQMLETFRANRTVIVIAHRLSTIEQADQILVCDGGRVTERGTFAELIEDDGLFARLYTVQRGLRGTTAF